MIALFIIITLFSLPTINEKNILKTNVFIDNEQEITNSTVYLLNKNNYLVLVNILLKEKLPEKRIVELIEYLKEDNKNISNNYKGYIPKNTQVINCLIKDNNLTLELSSDIITISDNKLSGLIHSLLMLNYFDTVTINVENTNDNRFNTTYDNTIPINVEYTAIDRNDNTKVVIYYLEDKNNYVPVTKYNNSNKEKIEIIIDELKNNIPSNLKSYIESSLIIDNYVIESDYIALNISTNNPSQELILDEIAQTVFSNYEVSTLIIKVNNNLEKVLTKPIK